MSTLVFDQLPARRPTLDDFGGGQKQDDADFPPDPRTDLTADDFNQLGLTLTRLALLAPALLVSLHVTAERTSGRALGLASGANAPTPGALDSAVTAVRTGPGHVVVSVDPRVLASSGMPPQASVVYDGSTTGLCRMVQCAQQPDGIHVQTFDVSGAFVDCDVLLTIY